MIFFIIFFVSLHQKTRDLFQDFFADFRVFIWTKNKEKSPFFCLFLAIFYYKNVVKQDYKSQRSIP